MTGPFGTTPGEWTWVEFAMSNGEPQSEDWKRTGMAALVSDAELVCWFGDAEAYYPTEGIEPSDADKRAIAKAPAMLDLILDMTIYALPSEDEVSQWQAAARNIAKELEKK